jgi:hypothetical protein
VRTANFNALPEYLRAGISAHFADYCRDILAIISGRREAQKISTKDV